MIRLDLTLHDALVVLALVEGHGPARVAKDLRDLLASASADERGSIVTRQDNTDGSQR